MKSMDIKRVGTVAVGALMLGAAVAGPVTASIDMTGVDKGFFYDNNFNPIVQIVVGEKGMATDAVAAGNIAAVIGNLAYTSTTKTVSPDFTPEGQVIISTSAVSATGDYIQDTDASLSDDFYDKGDGLYFDGVPTKTYEKGDFTQYALACDQQERSEAALLMEGTYNNIHCLFCLTLCIEQLKNPAHEMKEKITI
ncbi:MAG TPA: S-layer protein, partial [Candidatus Altiarchaeales archaeon]|nr:S-layer protein [Candidatus Altiarchaeales archaeon]